jgi:hypothetical protein
MYQVKTKVWSREEPTDEGAKKDVILDDDYFIIIQTQDSWSEIQGNDGFGREFGGWINNTYIVEETPIIPTSSEIQKDGFLAALYYAAVHFSADYEFLLMLADLESEMSNKYDLQTFETGPFGFTAERWQVLIKEYSEISDARRIDIINPGVQAEIAACYSADNIKKWKASQRSDPTYIQLYLSFKLGFRVANAISAATDTESVEAIIRAEIADEKAFQKTLSHKILLNDQDKYHSKQSLWEDIEQLMAVSLSSANELTVVQKNEISQVTGAVYTRDGVYLAKVNEEDVVCIVESGSTASDFKRPLKLKGVTHQQYKIIANIIKYEGSSNDANEYLWIAFTASNAAIESNSSMYAKLMSSFSSVETQHKTPLATTDNSIRAKASRVAVANIFLGDRDPTNGAVRWDGTDFVAWGLRSPNGTPHNKFEEYYQITIEESIYAIYLESQKSAYGDTVVYYGIPYSIPAEVFSDSANWMTGRFKYTTGYTSRYRIRATGSFGRSIFWKKL